MTDTISDPVVTLIAMQKSLNGMSMISMKSLRNMTIAQPVTHPNGKADYLILDFNK